ncbi:MAG TPA: response regulator [Gaiellaceae bacterium]|nr:response regulator [Gaiellaceae bacterium]
MAAKTLRPLILICDDELPLRELIKAVLGDRYRYLEAEDVGQAEEALRESKPEAIVLDVMLPGKSGLEFLSELRAKRRNAPIPVVVVSAWQSADDQRTALKAGADAFIGKPFDPKDLVSVVETLIAA